jgi:hypothetical protein
VPVVQLFVIGHDLESVPFYVPSTFTFYFSTTYYYCYILVIVLPIIKILIVVIVSVYILLLSLLNDNFDLLMVLLLLCVCNWPCGCWNGTKILKNYYYYYSNDVNCLLLYFMCVLFFFTHADLVIGLWAKLTLTWIERLVVQTEGSCEHGNEPSDPIKCWEILEQFRNWWLFKDSTLCS